LREVTTTLEQANNKVKGELPVNAIGERVEGGIRAWLGQLKLGNAATFGLIASASEVLERLVT
jgi:hypothetical protein